MSIPRVAETRAPVGADGNGAVHSSWVEVATSEDDKAWLARTRVNLSPMAAPSIMGLFGFMIATLMVGAWQAGWYGGPTTPLYLWPLALVVGGVMQAVAAVACSGPATGWPLPPTRSGVPSGSGGPSSRSSR